jgi:N-acetylneuraminic acid mutarotase
MFRRRTSVRFTDAVLAASTRSVIEMLEYRCLLHGAGELFHAHVNFQPASASIPAGYLVDGGDAFADRGNGYSYGWNQSLTTGARDRNSGNSPDQRYDTLNHMQQYGNRSWEIAVPNGDYEVHVVSGDPSYTNSVYRVSAEDVLTVSGTPTSGNRWIEGTQTVTVTDGRLTISNASGASNNKINFIDITQIDTGEPGLPTVTISANDPTASEDGPSSGQLTITRTGDTTNPLSVNYVVTGSATSVDDYSTIFTSEIIPAGQASVVVNVNPVDDDLVEGSETVIVTLAADSAYTVGGANQGTVTIADNDSAPPPNQPPDHVEVHSPAGGSNFPPGADITIEAHATDSDGTIELIEYFVNGVEIGETTGGETEFTWDNVAAGNYTLTVRATDDDGAPATSSAVNITVSDPSATQPGLTGQYYDNQDLTNLKVTRVDPTVNFYWGTGSPDASVGSDTFSARWTGFVQPQYSQLYRFYVDGNNGVRLWVNDQLIIDRWTDAYGEVSGTINLQASVKVPIKLEFFEYSGSANAKLSWSSSSRSKQVIPTSALSTSNNQPPPNTAPQVSVLSPADGSEFNDGDDIALSASASDTDGNVTKVEFLINGVEVGEDANGLDGWNFVWNDAPPGIYSVIANATDDDGAVTGSSPVLFNVIGVGPTQSPYGGVPRTFSTTVQAEDYDLGGEGVAYHDTTPANDKGSYRTDGVDVEPSTDVSGGFNLGKVRVGEWLEYTINVPETRNYIIETRVASGSSGGTFHIEFDGVNKTGTLTLPGTGGWQNWQTVKKTGVSLTAGVHVMRLSIDSGSTDVGNVNWIRVIAQSNAQPTWSTKANLPVAREEVNSAAVGGKLYVFGGLLTFDFLSTRRVDVYNPTNNTWTRVSDMPEAFTHAGVVVDGTDIWFVGGYFGDHPGPGYTGVWKYNTLSDTWTEGPDLPEARGAGGAGIVGRKIYFFGGMDSTRTIDKTEMWMLDLDNLAAGWEARAPLPGPTNHVGAASLNGKVYAIGGELDGGQDYRANLDSLYEYDPVTNQWSNKAPLPFPASHFHQSTMVYNGRIIIVGGEPEHNVSMDYVLAYNPATNTWESLGVIPQKRRAMGAGIIGNQIVATGGYDGGQKNNTWMSSALNFL